MPEPSVVVVAVVVPGHLHMQRYRLQDLLMLDEISHSCAARRILIVYDFGNDGGVELRVDGRSRHCSLYRLHSSTETHMIHSPRRVGVQTLHLGRMNNALESYRISYCVLGNTEKRPTCG